MKNELKKYSEKDFVDVVDAAGNDLPAVPKAWIGTDLLDPGVKKKGKDSGSSSSSGSTPAKREPGTEPAGNASRDEWAAFAAEKGAKPEDLVVDGKDLTRDELRDKYGTPSS